MDGNRSIATKCLYKQKRCVVFRSFTLGNWYLRWVQLNSCAKFSCSTRQMISVDFHEYTFYMGFTRNILIMCQIYFHELRWYTVCSRKQWTAIEIFDRWKSFVLAGSMFRRIIQINATLLEWTARWSTIFCRNRTIIGAEREQCTCLCQFRYHCIELCIPTHNASGIGTSGCIKSFRLRKKCQFLEEKRMLFIQTIYAWDC